MENNLLFPFWVGKIFISFKASRQPYIGSRGLVSWSGGWFFLSTALVRPQYKSHAISLESKSSYTTKIVQIYFSSTLPLQNHHYYVIEIFKLKYLSPIRTVREIRTVRQQSDRVRRSGQCRTSSYETARHGPGPRDVPVSPALYRFVPRKSRKYDLLVKNTQFW